MAADGQTMPERGEAGEGGARGAITLSRRVTIHPDRPLPEFGSTITPAFVAEDAGAPGEPHLALICGLDLLPRIEVAGALEGLGGTGLMRLVELKPLDWPGMAGKRMAFAYARPEGGRLISALNATWKPVDPAWLLTDVITPLVAGLGEMYQRNLTHRAIRPDNLFYLDRDRRRLALGPCVGVPAGYDQPVQFEPIERAIADPVGRGHGTRADDMFALGVTLMSLAIGRVPLVGMAADAQFALRVERGSYDAYLGDSRVPPQLLECLRGLVTDSRADRWTFEHFKSWLEGKRFPPARRAPPATRASTPANFAGHDCYTARELAEALGRKWEAAGDLLRTEAVPEWVRRDLADPQRADIVRSAMVQSSSVKGPAGAAVTVARVAMALDPPAPIRYRGMSVQFDGLGAALAAAVSDTASIQALAELMRRGLPVQWRHAQVAPAPNAAAAASAEQGGSTQLLLAEKLLRWMESAAAGQGFERCLYELNANIPCRSPLVAASWVGDPGDLLKALEVTARSAPGVPPADRHVAAFLAARGRSDIANHLIAICAGKRDGPAAIGMMTAYAWMQRTANVGPLPKLAAWCLPYLKPAIEAYHYRPLRTKIDQRVSEAAREGDLTGMLSAVDNIEQLRRDETGFRAAVGEFARAEHEVHVCTTRGDERALAARRSGREMAAMAAAALSMVAMSAVIMMGGL